MSDIGVMDQVAVRTRRGQLKANHQIRATFETVRLVIIADVLPFVNNFPCHLCIAVGRGRVGSFGVNRCPLRRVRPLMIDEMTMLKPPTELGFCDASCNSL